MAGEARVSVAMIAPLFLNECLDIDATGGGEGAGRKGRQGTGGLAFHSQSRISLVASIVSMRMPCDEAVMRSAGAAVGCAAESRTWVLAGTILGSSIAFIDSTVV